MKQSLLQRCLAEFLGTFAIVFFGCGVIATVGTEGGIAGHLAVCLTFGFVVAAMIYAIGHISSAHFNPAVTLAFASTGQFARRDVLPYWIAQAGGAILASTAHALFLPEKAATVRFGATLPTVTFFRAFGLEVLLTFFLMFVIYSVATDARVHGAVAGCAIGLMIAVCSLFGGPLTGCSMNPARSLGPALFAGGSALTTLGIYFVGPVIGAIIAVHTYEALRGKTAVYAVSVTENRA